MNNLTDDQKQLTKARRRRLSERLRILRERARLLEEELTTYTSAFFRVCIFGSARIKPEDDLYALTFALAEGLGELGIDVLTGGGPGLMEAANRGLLAGKAKAGSQSKSFGITIELNRFEPHSEHLEVKQHHRRFSSRLDDFMRLSNAIIVVPGGIGTTLELFFAWQLLQVGHMVSRPIILVDKAFWSGLLEWMKTQLVTKGLVSGQDFSWIHVVDTTQEAIALVRAEYDTFKLTHGEKPIVEAVPPEES